MKESQGFWLSYIDALTVFVAVFLLVVVFSVTKSRSEKQILEREREKYRLDNKEMVEFTKAWEKAQKKLTDLGAHPYVDMQNGGWKLEIAEKILFDIDQWELKPDGKNMLDKIRDILNEFIQSDVVNQSIRIVIGGHTDKETGKADWNLILSDRRADAVSNVLKQKLEKKVIIESVGFSFKFPKADAQKLEEHRRISITIQPIAVKYLNKPDH